MNTLYLLTLFIVPTILYGVSWNMYRQGTTEKDRADILYFAALAIQLMLLVGVTFAFHRSNVKVLR